MIGEVKMKDYKEKLIYLVKQLFPFKYRSVYWASGKQIKHTWRVWFGKCFNSSQVTIRTSKLSKLVTLCNSTKILEAPVKTERHGEWCEFLIPIGDNETAFITMTKEAYYEANRIMIGE